ncbi:hypothetical protein B0H63DRAFT_522689 [Podospora didyma]|uniref:Uncharacterized protein n=1 Tax=Podospora didyma TaxID=330526 RepID=A0AAE0NPL1_9PEZI|nr:hypothetical protein B0H63DRAFT_522689 [Podospora didyma]
MTSHTFSLNFNISGPGTYTPTTSDYNRERNNGWETMALPSLVRRYGSGFADDYRDIVLVLEDNIPNNSTQGTAWSDWLCNFFDWPQLSREVPHKPTADWCQSDGIANTARPVWLVDLDHLDGSPRHTIKNSTLTPLKAWGLSERTKLGCRLLVYPMFWWLTSACNVVIASILTGMTLFYKSTPLVTIGDVIDSYLCKPSTSILKATCTYGFQDFKNIYRPALEPREYCPAPKVRMRWWRAVGLMRWGLTSLCWLLALITTAAILAFTTQSEPDIFKRGVLSPPDQVSMASTISPHTSSADKSMKRLQLVVLANLPQFGLSVAYLLYNSLITMMVVEQEWHSFGLLGLNPNALRVSQPRGFQRNTFFLSLPYQYAIPLLAVSTALQWLANQSLFFAEVDLWNVDGQRQDLNDSISTLGYYNQAMFWIVMTGLLLWVVVVGIGYICTYEPSGMPMLGACSAVIAASCHLPGAGWMVGDVIACGPLTWGELHQDTDGGVDEMWLGFSAGAPRSPQAGEIYG